MGGRPLEVEIRLGMVWSVECDGLSAQAIGGHPTEPVTTEILQEVNVGALVHKGPGRTRG